MYETLELERRGAAAIIRLNRPEALNAWNDQLGRELLDAVRSVAEDDAVRAVGVTGSGRAFSSGADLRDMAGRPLTAEGHIDVHTTLTTVYHPILTTLRRMPKPVVAARQRPGRRHRLLAGAGVRPASSAPSRPTCCWPSSTSASCPTAARSPSSPRARARGARPRWRCSASASAPPSCCAPGSPTRSSPTPSSTTDVRARLDAFAAGPTRSYAGSKRQLNAWLYAGLDEQLELEARIQQEMAGIRRLPRGRHRVPREARRRTSPAHDRAALGRSRPRRRGPARERSRSPPHEYNARRLGSRAHPHPSPRLRALAARGDRGRSRPRRRRLRGLLDARVRAARRTPTASTRSTRSSSPSRPWSSSASRACCCTR